MILHVVGELEEGETVEKQDELPIDEAPSFFIKRILSSSTSPVHRFADESNTKSIISKIISQDDEFVSHAYELSRLFAKAHAGNTADGAFFVILLSCSKPETSFVCLIKYDYREAVELIEKEGRAGLRSIVQAFVADRNAVQKLCVARVENGIVQSELSASDRSKKAPDLTHYFETFLDVTRERSDEQLSQGLQEAIRKTLSLCKEILPDSDVPQALSRVNDALRGRELVGQEAVVDAVFAALDRPDDADAKKKIEVAVGRQMKAQRLQGVEFRPNQRIFRRGARRKIVTVEGVEVRFNTGHQGELVIERALEGGGREIVIKTNDEYRRDETLPS
ncbi:hypothetical protein SAMN05444272_1385 [Roseibium suaedae]|uniref:Nucleoid-associated protein n=2 Tax=Roseibium suaedae TaxID=735517 RepID=A0A1M7D670_9HYPH|nr:hypothetical protein SAMN05444272_1385 [Roseibium suaedae]